MNSSGYIDTNSSRARKTRVYKILRPKFFRIGMQLIGVISFIAAATAYFYMPVFSGMLMSISLLTFMFLTWFKADLSNLNVVAQTSEKVDQILDKDILANISPRSSSAWAVWKAIQGLPAANFFAYRFGLSNDLFENLLSKEPKSEGVVWQQVEAIRSAKNSNFYSQEIVMAGLIMSIPNIEPLLASARLSKADIMNGVDWTDSLKQKAERAKTAKNFGGIARDWTYGHSPILQRYGYNISKDIERFGFYEDTEHHSDTVENMITFMAKQVNSIALVGDMGVGKTTVVHAFAEKILENSTHKNIRYSQVISINAETLVAESASRGKLERVLVEVLNEAHHAKNIILFFDNAELFFKDGTGSVDVGNILGQVIGGRLRFIFAFTPKDLQAISVSNPQIVAKLQPINIEQPTKLQALHILQNQVLFLEAKHNVTFSYQSLQEAYDLAKRYEQTLAMPGAALKVLESAVAHADHSYISAETVRIAVEASIGIKLHSADTRERSSLLDLESELARYVVGQQAGVKVVSDALRRSRSGIGSQDKPIGTFLFLGPTGVGKTELAKALARTYFNEISSMIRIDMNQYVNDSDIHRLISSRVDGNQLSFLEQVRARPFSVILFDEIEKASRSIQNALLQLLDEGIMKDELGKEVSFKDAIIIASSNAGVAVIREMIKENTIDSSSAVSRVTQTLVDTNTFVPEFINRFDEIILFKPLTKTDLSSIIDIIIADINRTVGQKKIIIEVDDDGKQWLINKGYDPLLGARPIRRTAQRYIENIVAKKMLTGVVKDGDKVYLSVADFEAEDV